MSHGSSSITLRDRERQGQEGGAAIGHRIPAHSAPRTPRRSILRRWFFHRVIDPGEPRIILTLHRPTPDCDACRALFGLDD
jgi:hypothetical protein